MVIFTTVSEDKFREVARWLVNEKYTPDWFADLEYINWDRHIKDLRFIPNTSTENVILVDDYSLYIHPEQIDNWIEIKSF
ncbi:MAG: NIF family HAD-type phosphatase [Xenococcaceae cyanobacterium]